MIAGESVLCGPLKFQPCRCARKHRFVGQTGQSFQVQRVASTILWSRAVPALDPYW